LRFSEDQSLFNIKLCREYIDIARLEEFSPKKFDRIFLLLGAGGVGKTTLLHLLAGSNFKNISDKEYKPEPIDIALLEFKVSSAMNFTTRLPMIYKGKLINSEFEGDETYIIDMPAINASLTEEEEFARCHIINKVIEKAKKIYPIFLISNKSMGEKGTELREQFRRLNKIIPEYDDKITFLLTKFSEEEKVSFKFDLDSLILELMKSQQNIILRYLVTLSNKLNAMNAFVTLDNEGRALILRNIYKTGEITSNDAIKVLKPVISYEKLDGLSLSMSGNISKLVEEEKFGDLKEKLLILEGFSGIVDEPRLSDIIKNISGQLTKKQSDLYGEPEKIKNNILNGCILTDEKANKFCNALSKLQKYEAVICDRKLACECYSEKIIMNISEFFKKIIEPINLNKIDSLVVALENCQLIQNYLPDSIKFKRVQIKKIFSENLRACIENQIRSYPFSMAKKEIVSYSEGVKCLKSKLSQLKQYVDQDAYKIIDKIFDDFILSYVEKFDEYVLRIFNDTFLVGDANVQIDFINILCVYQPMKVIAGGAIEGAFEKIYGMANLLMKQKLATLKEDINLIDKGEFIQFKAEIKIFKKLSFFIKLAETKSADYYDFLRKDMFSLHDKLIEQVSKFQYDINPLLNHEDQSRLFVNLFQKIHYLHLLMHADDRRNFFLEDLACSVGKGVSHFILDICEISPDKFNKKDAISLINCNKLILSIESNQFIFNYFKLIVDFQNLNYLMKNRLRKILDYSSTFIMNIDVNFVNSQFIKQSERYFIEKANSLKSFHFKYFNMLTENEFYSYDDFLKLYELSRKELTELEFKRESIFDFFKNKRAEYSRATSNDELQNVIEQADKDIDVLNKKVSLLYNIQNEYDSSKANFISYAGSNCIKLFKIKKKYYDEKFVETNILCDRGYNDRRLVPELFDKITKILSVLKIIIGFQIYKTEAADLINRFSKFKDNYKVNVNLQVDYFVSVLEDGGVEELLFAIPLIQNLFELRYLEINQISNIFSEKHEEVVFFILEYFNDSTSNYGSCDYLRELIVKLDKIQILLHAKIYHECYARPLSESRNLLSLRLNSFLDEKFKVADFLLSQSEYYTLKIQLENLIDFKRCPHVGWRLIRLNKSFHQYLSHDSKKLLDSAESIFIVNSYSYSTLNIFLKQYGGIKDAKRFLVNYFDSDLFMRIEACLKNIDSMINEKFDSYVKIMKENLKYNNFDIFDSNYAFISRLFEALFRRNIVIVDFEKQLQELSSSLEKKLFLLESTYLEGNLLTDQYSLFSLTEIFKKLPIYSSITHQPLYYDFMSKTVSSLIRDLKEKDLFLYSSAFFHSSNLSSFLELLPSDLKMEFLTSAHTRAKANETDLKVNDSLSRRRSSI
jgi:hypothetical protein